MFKKPCAVVDIGLILKSGFVFSNFPGYSYLTPKFSRKSNSKYWVKLSHKNCQNIAKRSRTMDLERFATSQSFCLY